MAHFLKDQPTRSMSSGRGGAGNIGRAPPSTGPSAADLETPTIKSQTYTTGRGGQGNMVPNENPDNARAAQDVEAPAYHAKEPKGTYHWGRGGEGNMTTLGGKNADKEVRKEQEQREKVRTTSRGNERRPSKGLMEKGKEMFGMGGKKGDENAVDDK